MAWCMRMTGRVVKLVVHKLLDSEGDCNGRTVVEASKFVGVYNM